MGALLAVNQGSTEPPKMIALIYKGKEEWTDVIDSLEKVLHTIQVVIL